MSQLEGHPKLLFWLSIRILPHEAEVRAWLGRTLSNRSDVEDVLQEAYCRLSSLTEPDAIENPRAYFFQVIKNVVVDEIRRAKVVRIESRAEIDELPIFADYLTPERAASARQELARVQQLIEDLPPRCRRIFRMRKIEGLSQKEIAVKLGVSENIVENEAARGLKRILKVIEGEHKKSQRPVAGRRGHRQRGRIQDS